MKRKPLIPLYIAQQLYGTDKTTFCRPSYVPDGCCQWCGKKIEGNRKKSFCSSDCSKRYNYFVTWNRGRGSYSTHILRRDNFTCQDCGEIHRTVNELGIEIPVSDGNLELHHIQFVCNGGDDSPDNLVTLCHKCHVERHIKVKEE